MRIMRRRVMAFVVALLLTVTTVIGDANFTVRAEEAVNILPAFDFTAENAPAAQDDGSLSVSATEGNGTISLNGASYTGFFVGGLTANNWSVGDYWLVSVDATGYDHLSFVSSIRGSKTAPLNWGVQYSLDGGNSWSDDVASYTATTNLRAQGAATLPETAGNGIVLFKVYVQNDISIKGETILTSGNVNFNNVKITGTPAGSVEEPPVTPEIDKCANVVASVEAGEVVKGTEVSLSTATEYATVYYNTNGSDNYLPYENAIVINEDTTIKTYAFRDGYEDSDVLTFTYTIKDDSTEEPPVIEPPVSSETTTAYAKTTEIADGDQVVISYTNNNNETYGMTSTPDAGGKKLTGSVAGFVENATLADGTAVSDVFTVSEELTQPAVLTVHMNEDGTCYFTQDVDGVTNYLTCPPTGNGLSFATELGDYSIWSLASATDGYFIRSVNAVYTKNGVDYPQYMEYYNGFTTYNYTNDTSKDIYYTFQFNKSVEIVVEKEVPPVEPPVEEKTIATKDNTFVDGDQLIIFYPESKVVMSTTANGKKLTGIEATVDSDQIEVTEGMAVFTVAKDAETGFYTLSCDGKYLTSGATGSALSLEDTASEYSLWYLEENGDKLHVANANAKYNNTTVQYLEYYNGFTTYSYKSASDTAYNFELYKTVTGVESGFTYDKKVTTQVAAFAGNANYDEAKVTTSIKGDLVNTNDMLDASASYTAVVSGKNVKPYTSAVSSATGSTSYYMGGVGFGSGTNDYAQFALSSLGKGDMTMSFRMRSSNTGAGTFQLQYSVDGTTFENFTTGTYHYQYTQYAADGSTSDVNQTGTITDGIAHTEYASAKYVEFTFDVPAGANNAENLYIRLVPGNTSANKKSTPTSSGTMRIDSVVISGHPASGSAIVNAVVADPASGEASVGTEVSLSTKTAGATIYYSVNGGEFAVYDETNKPVLSSLPCFITTYATKDGLQKSAEIVYQYTQATCSPVKATPNGGAVMKNAKLSLKTTTEGATILYAFDNGTEDLVWNTYVSPITLSELPCTVYAKVTKAGCTDSAISTLNFTEKSNEKYNIYFGQIHAHTNYSDGSGTVEEAFAHATKVANLDFLAVTDHSNSLDNAANSKISENVDTKDTDEWTSGHALAAKYSSDNFTCMYGYEMTWSNGLGHMNTFATPGFQSRTQTAYATYSTALQNYYAALKTVPDSISQFNHPGTTFGDFSDFAYFDSDIDGLITLIEVGNGEGTVGSSGYFPSYEYYTRALDKGWHVAPSNNQDNHKGKWGDANTARTVALADTNTEDSIYDAMRNYRVYATEDNNLSVYYTLDGNIMGSTLDQEQVGETVSIKAEISDASANDKIGKVEVIVNGGLSIASTTVSTNEETVTFDVPAKYSYYYIKITEADGDIAVTAPVWVGSVEACGINGVSTTKALAVQNEELDVNVELFNNEKSELAVDRVVVTLSDAEGNTTTVMDKTGAELGVESVASNSTKTITCNYTYGSAGKVTYEVTIYGTLAGTSKVYSDKLDVNYVIPAMVTNVIIDGTHYNDYVSGYYGGNVNRFVSICAENNIKATVATKEITAEDLKDCSLLVLAAPAKKTGTANSGDYTPSHYSDEFLAMVADYVNNGGSVIVCGLADYSDSADGQTATEQNKLLEAIGATIRMNSDEVYDEVNNGGQAYRLYPTNFNMDSKYLAGVVKGQTYSQYSGCSVDISNAVENDKVYAGEALVSGFDTTYSINCKDDNGASAGNTANDNKGNVTFIAHQSTKAGGEIFVAGGVFLSDFEVKAEIDNNDSLPYANYNIVKNILEDVKAVLPVSTIAEARQGEMGDVFAVEGYVTSGTSNEFTTFFDTIYIQDDTAGIDIFPYAEAGLEIGTKMKITGYVSEYQGDKELKVISYEILPDAPYVYEAKEVSTKDATDYANLGGSLLKTTGKVTRVDVDSNGSVSEFWLMDETGVEAAIFIDGYIYSGTTGKNELADFVKVGSYVTASGVLYMHPEGDSDVSVPVFRVRNCDDIVPTTPDDSPEEPVKDQITDVMGTWVSGGYSIKKAEVEENESRIRLVETPDLIIGHTYKASITDSAFRFIIRMKDEMGRVRTKYMQNNDEFTVEEGYTYYIGVYEFRGRYQNLTFEKYVELFNNGLSIDLKDTADTKYDGDAYDATLASGQTTKWISGCYNIKTATLDIDETRISLMDALEVVPGTTYTAVIAQNGSANFDFRYIIRRKDEKTGKVITSYLNNGKSFVAEEGYTYYVTVYPINSNYGTMSYDKYVELMNSGFVFNIK